MSLLYGKKDEPQKSRGSILYSVDGYRAPLVDTYTTKQAQQPQQPQGQSLLSQFTAPFTRLGRGLSQSLSDATGLTASREADVQSRFNSNMDIIGRWGKMKNDPNVTAQQKANFKKLYDVAVKDNASLTGQESKEVEQRIDYVDPRKGAASVVELGLLAGTGVAGRAAGLGARPVYIAGKGVTQVAPKLGQLTAQQLARATAVTAAEGALGGSSAYLGREDNVTTSGLLKATAGGAVLGGAIPGVGSGLSRGTTALKNVRASRALTKVETDDLVDGLINASKATENQYNQGFIKNFFQRSKEFLNESTELRKIDQAKARLAGVKVNAMKKTESLEQARDDVLSSSTRAQQELARKTSTGDSAYDVIQKHAKDNDRFNVYRAALADKVARKKGVRFQKQLSDKDLDKIIKDYEATNPLARTDIKTLNEHVNNVRRLARGSGAISDELDAKLGNDPFYTPITTVKAKDVPKAKMGGRAVTRGKQTFVKEATGADAPVEYTFDSIISYAEGGYKNAAEARLSQLLLDAHKKGIIKGSKVLSEPGAKAMKKDLRDYASAVTAEAKKLQKKLSFTKKEARTLQSEINKFNKEGLEVSMKKGGKTPLPEFNVEGLGLLKTQSGKSITSGQFFKSLVEADPKDIARLQKKIALREPRLAAKLDEITKSQTNISALKSEARGARQATYEIVDDPSTNLSTIKGLDENGQAFTLEMPPQLTRLIRGTDIDSANSVVKFLQGVNRVYQTAWTGVINPVFNFVVQPLYDVMGNVNALVDNPSAFVRSFTPDAFGEMFKGMKNSTKFRQQLISSGATPQGGSLLAQDMSKNVQSIMSHRNFASRTGFLVKNPMEAVKALDQFSGKLGNTTRTRLAKGYYDDALKKGMTEAEALKEAAFAFNNLSPNFQRTSQLAKNMNAFIPYVTAATAGNRSMWQPILTNPARAAKVYGGIAATMAGAVAHNLNSDIGREFYDKMAESDNQYVLDNNIIIVLPTASYDKDTGEWSGIIKIPVAPELRNLNKIAQNSTQQAIRGDSKLNPVMVAGALFNTMTGGVAESAAQGPPVVRTAMTAFGNSSTMGNIWDAKPLVRGSMVDLPKEEQVYDWTSNPGRFFSEITGRKISPIQADAIINQFGSPGRTLTGTGLREQVSGRFTGVRTKTEESKFYEAYNPVSAKKAKVNTQINKAIEKRDYGLASQLARDFNESIKPLENMDGSKKGLLEALRFPVENGRLKQSSIDARLKNMKES